MNTPEPGQSRFGLTGDAAGNARHFYNRQAALLALAARNPGLFPGAGPVAMGRVCDSSGYCGCRCRPCLGGRHSCGHRKGCHKSCRSVA